MANTNAQAVAWAEKRTRPMSDLLYTTYLSAKKIVAEWNAQQLALVIANDATLIADLSAADGRPPITNANATNNITRATEYITWYEGTGTLAATAGRDTTIVACQQNGRSIF